MYNCTENVMVAHSLEYPVILKDNVFFSFTLYKNQSIYIYCVDLHLALVPYVWHPEINRQTINRQRFLFFHHLLYYV